MLGLICMVYRVSGTRSVLKRDGDVVSVASVSLSDPQKARQHAHFHAVRWSPAGGSSQRAKVFRNILSASMRDVIQSAEVSSMAMAPALFQTKCFPTAQQYDVRIYYSEPLVGLYCFCFDMRNSEKQEMQWYSCKLPYSSLPIFVGLIYHTKFEKELQPEAESFYSREGCRMRRNDVRGRHNDDARRDFIFATCFTINHVFCDDGILLCLARSWLRTPASNMQFRH